MPGAMPPPAPQSASFHPGGISGMGPAQSGYGAAQSNLMNSLQASNNTTSSQQMQLGQQLQQNQGNVAQSLTNRGLGNTTIANTMAQVPQQTYNMGMAQVQNQGALRQMQAYQALAGVQAQGGMGISQLSQPYAQQNAINSQVAASQPGPQSDFQKANAVNQMNQAGQNRQNAGQQLYYPGLTGYGAPQPNAPAPAGTPTGTTPIQQSQGVQGDLTGPTPGQNYGNLMALMQPGGQFNNGDTQITAMPDSGS